MGVTKRRPGKCLLAYFIFQKPAYYAGSTPVGEDTTSSNLCVVFISRLLPKPFSLLPGVRPMHIKFDCTAPITDPVIPAGDGIQPSSATWTLATESYVDR
jgi:hypothetical protein